MASRTLVHVENRGLWVLLASGLLGFHVGMTGFPDWQVAVETSQVVAGLVDYPAGTPFYIYHTKLWTILHQICALVLRAGVSEIRLSLVLSGVLGMVTFQALAMFVYAFSRDAVVAIGAAALIFFTRSAEYGAVYPLFLLGTEHTYGVIGLSTSVLIISLLGAGWHRTGALLLGLAPAIHPSLGTWTGILVGCALLSDFRRLREELRPALPWFLGGCAITTVSLIVQFTLIYHAPQGQTRLSPQDLHAFIVLWDGHRAAVDMTHPGVLLNVGTLAIASIWLAFFATDLPRPSLFLLRVTLAGAILSLALALVSWIPPEKLPTALLVLMPGRFLNFGAMTFVALLLALLVNRRALWSRILTLVLVGGLLFGDHSMFWEWLEQSRGVRFNSPVHPLQFVWATGVALVVGTWWSRSRPAARPSMSATIAHAMAVVLLIGGSAITRGFSQPRSAAFFRDRTNDPFFAQVAAGSGVLLTAGDLHLIQLRTRRPVLVDSGALDTVLYSLETGASMQRILRDVYGLDLLNPPKDAIGAGRIPPLAHQGTWEAYSPEKWHEIKRAFGVSQVLTYPDWTLNLPLAAQSRRMLLYDIPD